MNSIIENNVIGLDDIKISLESISKEIIKKSIKSAVCIDDMFVPPYMTLAEQRHIESQLSNDREGNPQILNSDIPKSLYHSFRSDGECDLDIYHFKSFAESWRPKIILNNKDLLVIDWELDPNQGYGSTLEIISEVISTDTVPFIIIYTHKPIEDFKEIVAALIFKFNFCSREQLVVNENKIKQGLISAIKELTKNTFQDSLDDQVQLFLENPVLNDNLVDLITTPDKYEEVLLNIIDDFCMFFSIENKKSAERKFKKVFEEVFTTNDTHPLENFYYHLVGTVSNETFDLKRIRTSDFGFKINNTIITIFSKPGLEGNPNSVSPENVYDKFSTLISKAPHNFITLLSIEMRDRLKEDIRKIGVDIAGINEKAFFKHMDNYHSQNEFFDFLLKTWVNDLSEYNLNLKPKIFTIVEEYRKQNSLLDIKADKITDALASLGYRLSTVLIPDRLEKDKSIRFGDIFQIITFPVDENENLTSDYVLSITPHCVCADPNKIDNNFYFVKTKAGIPKITTAIKNIETGFYSIINNNQQILSIEWECKPFTMYIECNDLTNLQTSYKNKPIKLKYITTLKEVFAQRISNESFSYGTAIGIDLPH